MKKINILIFFLAFTILGIQGAQAQCGTLSGNLGGNDVSSSSGSFSVLTFCGITDGGWIGSGTTSGSATWTIPGGTNYIEIDFNGLSNGGGQEYLEISINGEFVDLNNANTSFTSGIPGCNSTAVALVTSSTNLGFPGISGVIISDDTNGAGKVGIELPSCTINTITVNNVVTSGSPNGSVIQIRYCEDAPTGSACTGLNNPPSPDTDGDGIADNMEAAGEENDPCLPVQNAGYTGYDAGNATWAAADCDGDGITNGAEDGTSDPYDVCDNSHTAADICNLCNTTDGTNQSLALCAQDCDNGGISNAEECDAGTDPTVAGDDPSCSAGTAAPVLIKN